MFAWRHLELPEDVGLAGRFVFGLDIDGISALRIGARSHQDEFGAFVVEKLRILRRKAPTAKFLLERFRVVRLVPIRQPSAGRRPGLRILDGKSVRRLPLDIQFLLNSPGRSGSSSS